MESSFVRSFTERFLLANDCQLIEQAPTHLTAKLSVPVDKDLLNRPFYWMYVEKMNLPPETAQLTLVFDSEYKHPSGKAEYLFFGSPRFTKILESAQKQGKWVRLYQEPARWQQFSNLSKPYTPWLCVNFFISYVCDQKKDRIACLGINLLTGEIREGFYQEIKQLKWTAKLPPKRYLLEPALSLSEAVGELEDYLLDQLLSEDLTWANQAKQRMEEELEQLKLFFPENENRDEEQEKARKMRIQEIVWQYHPRVEIDIVNAGIFYREEQVTRNH